VTVFSRQLKLTDYADVYTRKRLEWRKSSCCFIVKPDAYRFLGSVVDLILKSGVTIAKLQMIQMDKHTASEFASIVPADADPKGLAEVLSADVCVLGEVVGEDCVPRMVEVAGPADPQEAQSVAPSSIRALYGTSLKDNALHVSSDSAAGLAECEFFFGPEGSGWETTAKFQDSTCCIIRPHAIRSAGKIIERIQSEGFEISALKLFHLDRRAADEFLEVYKNVLPETASLSEEMHSGPCVVMELRKENAVDSLRALCGPHDPEIARHLRPETLRAKFGIDRVKNAVHCTDLSDDGVLECQYFFQILHSASR